MMNRRHALLLAALLCTARSPAALAALAALPGPQRLATAWRLPSDGGPDSGQHVGIVAIDRAAGQVQLAAAQPVPTRAHGQRRG